MNTFLLTWNKKSYPFDEINDEISIIQKTGACPSRWSCGKSKRLKPGDRVFLLKQGEEPRDIVASEVVTSHVFPDRHFIPEKALKGETANYVNVNWTALLNPEKSILPRVRLDASTFTSVGYVNWNTQMSGIEIDDLVAQVLEKVWEGFLAKMDFEETDFYDPLGSPDEVGTTKKHKEGKVKTVVVNIYERDNKAREDCIKAHGWQCRVCEFMFEEKYGDIGKDFIHVHHLIPLHQIGKEYEVDGIKDLVPVCPNCHAMLHRRRNKECSINELRKMIEDRQRKSSLED